MNESVWWCPECKTIDSIDGIDDDGCCRYCGADAFDIPRLVEERERLLVALRKIETRLSCPCSWCWECIEKICKALDDVDDLVHVEEPV